MTVVVRSSRVATNHNVVEIRVIDNNSAVATRTMPTHFPCRHANTAKSASRRRLLRQYIRLVLKM